MDTTEPALHTGSYASGRLWTYLLVVCFRMPSRLETVIGWINDIPNEETQQLVSRFVDFMKGTDTSENTKGLTWSLLFSLLDI